VVQGSERVEVLADPHRDAVDLPFLQVVVHVRIAVRELLDRAAHADLHEAVVVGDLGLNLNSFDFDLSAWAETEIGWTSHLVLLISGLGLLWFF